MGVYRRRGRVGHSQPGRYGGQPGVVTQVDQLLHGEELYVCSDAGYDDLGQAAEYHIASSGSRAQVLLAELAFSRLDRKHRATGHFAERRMG